MACLNIKKIRKEKNSYSLDRTLDLLLDRKGNSPLHLAISKRKKREIFSPHGVGENTFFFGEIESFNNKDIYYLIISLHL